MIRRSVRRSVSDQKANELCSPLQYVYDINLLYVYFNWHGLLVSL